MSNYPPRQQMPLWARCICMALGISFIIAALKSLFSHAEISSVAGCLVGGAWFGFGYYGGLPLVNTVSEWHQPCNKIEITNKHLQGLSVLRRRKWIAWALMPSYLAAGAFLMPWFARRGQLEASFFVIAIIMAVFSCRYCLSRCPRCGYGFFAGSTHRAAFLHKKNYCTNCGLTLKGQNRDTKEKP